MSKAKERFADCKVGDKVYCRMYGLGEIREIREWPYERVLMVMFYATSGCRRKYTLDGRHKVNEDTSEQILFYVDGDNKYLTKRPKPKLDWSKVPVDTKVTLGDAYKRHFAGKATNGSVKIWSNGTTSYTADEDPWWIDSSRVLLAEELTIDGITYPIGSN